MPERLEDEELDAIRTLAASKEPTACSVRLLAHIDALAEKLSCGHPTWALEWSGDDEPDEYCIVCAERMEAYHAGLGENMGKLETAGRAIDGLQQRVVELEAEAKMVRHF